MKKFYTLALAMAAAAFTANAADQVKLFSFTFVKQAADKTITFGVSSSDSQEMTVDWGDGKTSSPVKTGNYDETWEYTKITGKIAGTTVTVYGTNPSTVNTLDFSWDKNSGEECKITTIDLSQLSGLKDIDLTSNNLQLLDLKGCTSLTKLTANNNALLAITVAEGSKLATLSANNTDASGSLGTNRLSTLDFSRFPALKTLAINYNTDEGKTIKLDFSNNPELTQIDAMACGITDIDISKNTKLSTLRVNQNLLTSIDASTMNPAKKAIVFAIGNKLTSIKPAPDMSNFNISKNDFTFATLPAVADVKAKNYIYYPQNPMAVTPEGAVVDLSSQATVGETATVYSWAAGETPIESGYTENNGVFTFSESVTGAVCSMKNDLFPKLTLTTEAIDIKASGVADIEIENGEAEYFNLQGIRVADPEKGIFIRRQGGKTTKVIIR